MGQLTGDVEPARAARGEDSNRTESTQPGPALEHVRQLIAQLDAAWGQFESENEKLRESQRHLQQYRDRYVDLYEFAPLGYITLDIDGYVEEINLTGANMLGDERAKIIGYPFLEFVSRPDRDTLLNHLRRCAQEGTEVTSEVTLVACDGADVPVQLHSVPIEGPQGEVSLCKTAITDLSERRSMEEAMRESQAFLQTVIDSIPEPLSVLDMNYKIALANRCARELVDVGDASRGLLCHRLLEQSGVPCNLPDELCPLKTILRSKAPATVEHKHVDDGKETYVEIHAAPIFDAAGEIAMIMELRRDVTERRLAENLLQKAHDELEQRVAERTAELTEANEQLRYERQVLRRLLTSHDRERQLIACEMHDRLVQKLAAATMQFEAFEQQNPQPSQEALKNYRHGVDIVRECLEEARRLMIGVRPLILDELGVVAAIEDYVCECGNDEGPHIEFRSEVEFARLAPVLENALYRTVQDSLANASLHSKSEKVLVELTQQDDFVEVEIRDWGIGFEPAGLQCETPGLEGIRERAALLGGNATIDSSPGKGTRVVAKFPLSIED